ncbi:MAG: hypothetical protein BGO82_15065 [Devosia sp. 67-54]|uniref:SH3 domain-containing protein n=1 Tax=unclassified Devosia TaxID=196773 RepID=UPI00095F9539|nr:MULTISPECIES: SH3 domain-containing protein [unclassified Devosia]MBN9303690.1 SH3 domain-containing protein [Devosia sp.]OJX17568.1 MAG: hypothetical protein BGO82_15065 [Devosia sp. 67-54]
MPKLLLAALLAAAAFATPAAAAPIARASGVLVMRAGPGDMYPRVDRLAKDERVTVASCTRFARWCLVHQLDGGPSGWVPGSYLVGSAAKNAVTPFEFSFDPLDPGGFFRRR